LKDKNIDTLLLGCTHYPLLKNQIQKEIGYNVKVVDSATTCAEQLKEKLKSLNLQSRKKNSGKRTYFVSDDPKKFKIVGEDFLGLPIEKVELVRY
jgi:glutamate racemase